MVKRYLNKSNKHLYALVTGINPLKHVFSVYNVEEVCSYLEDNTRSHHCSENWLMTFRKITTIPFENFTKHVFCISEMGILYFEICVVGYIGLTILP